MTNMKQSIELTEAELGQAIGGIGMLLPAVQGVAASTDSRGSSGQAQSRRGSCSNNIKQIGIA